MKLYSYQGQEPAHLPERIRLENGTTLTSLDTLSQEELNFYGFSGPIEFPNVDIARQTFSWNGSEYVVEDIPQEVLEQREFDQEQKAIQNINNSAFLNSFRSTLFNKRIRKESVTDLKVNVLYTELISNIISNQIIADAFLDLKKICLTINFTEEEIQSLNKVLSDFKLPTNLTKPNEDYDFDSDSILDTSTRRFESWIWNGTKWVAPVPYPKLTPEQENDAEHRYYYLWNEENKSWDLNTVAI